MVHFSQSCKLQTLSLPAERKTRDSPTDEKEAGGVLPSASGYVLSCDGGCVANALDKPRRGAVRPLRCHSSYGFYDVTSLLHSFCWIGDPSIALPHADFLCDFSSANPWSTNHCPNKSIIRPLKALSGAHTVFFPIPPWAGQRWHAHQRPLAQRTSGCTEIL